MNKTKMSKQDFEREYLGTFYPTRPTFDWGKSAEKLSNLAMYFHVTRGVGHTHTMLFGAVNNDDIVVLVATTNDMDYLRRYMPKARFVVWESPINLENLRGLRKPLVIDNHAISHMLSDVASSITALRQENIELREELRSTRELYEESKKKKPFLKAMKERWNEIIVEFRRKFQ